MNQDALFMEIALKEAALAKADVPVGAIIVSGADILVQSHNQREELKDPTAHAEIIALRAAANKLGSWRLNGTTLYCTLEPCPMCAEAIIQARVSRLVFGAYDSICGAAGSAFNLFVPGRGLPIPEIVGGILEERCRNDLLEFFKKRREQTAQDHD
ncbi:MAG: nucleoside deaminase [Candidatus Obscuribacterales bacterium]|jgi:tRNA(adenine34) deaminase|nr:nucleoside deaminase [Candidatus Obscuribacterales bacterium]